MNWMNPWLIENRWVKEARDLPPDPGSGARITRLSGSSIRTENIYCEAPRASADGQYRFGVITLADGEGRAGAQVMRCVHHYCWLGNTGRFAGLVNFDPETFRHRPEHPEGELYIYASDGTPPRLVPVPEH
jgi:hypothetical protein